MKHDSITLAVDTSTPTLAVALLNSNKLLSSYHSAVSINHARTLLEIIDFLLKQSQIVSDKIDNYIVSVGPGSFTGVRIGISTVQAAAWAHKKPIWQGTTLKELAYAICSNVSTNNNRIVPVIDARKGQVYTAVYAVSNENKLIEQIAPTVTDSKKLALTLASFPDIDFILVGNGARKYSEDFKNSKNIELAPQQFDYPDAYFLALSVLFDEHALPVENGTPEPMYLRNSEAEISFDKKHNAQKKDISKIILSESKVDSTQLPDYLTGQEQLGKYKKQVLAKGAEIANKLSTLLSGKSMNVTLSDFTYPGDLVEGLKPIERLRKYLALIDKTIKKFSSNEYGICESCHKPISKAELDNMPWATICMKCHNKRT